MPLHGLTKANLLCLIAAGFVRMYVVALDAAQYQLDVNATAWADAPDVYPALNVVMRRDAKENNFKVRGGSMLCAYIIAMRAV